MYLTVTDTARSCHRRFAPFPVLRLQLPAGWSCITSESVVVLLIMVMMTDSLSAIIGFRGMMSV